MIKLGEPTSPTSPLGSANQGEEGSPDLRSAGYLLPMSGSEILRYDLALWQRGIERI